MGSGSARRALLALGLIATLGVAVAPMQLRVDLDGDGHPDTVLLYQHGSAVGVIVRFVDRAHPSQRFRFIVDPTREDGLCRLPVRLEAEPLDYDLAAAEGRPVPGFVRSAQAYGFRLVDGACDAIHFYWNQRTGRLAWWRL